MSNTRDEGTGEGYNLIKTQTSLPRRTCFCWHLSVCLLVIKGFVVSSIATEQHLGENCHEKTTGFLELLDYT